MQFKVETSLEDTVIVQTTSFHDDLDKLYSNVSRRILDTQELQTREALIKLGWTPPND